MRAGSALDLVYKQGQAGVTKAAVSVTFDNEDPLNRPPGYDDKRKIVVTRQARAFELKLSAADAVPARMPSEQLAWLRQAAAAWHQLRVHWHTCPPHHICPTHAEASAAFQHV